MTLPIRKGRRNNLAGEIVQFTANYTNTTGSSIVGNCSLTVLPAINNTAMTFNGSGQELYTYSTAILTPGPVSWSVNCTNDQGLANLSVSDTVLIQAGAVPEFSTMLMLLLVSISLIGLVKIRRQS